MALAEILARRNLPDEQRVVATGLGTVNPLGLDVPSTMDGLRSMKNGIVRVSEVLGYKLNPNVDVAGIVQGFDPEVYFPSVELGKIHRSAQFAYGGSVEALMDAGFLEGIPTPRKGSGSFLINVDPERFGDHTGTGVGGSLFAADVEDYLILSRLQELRDQGQIPAEIFETAILPIFSETGRLMLKRSSGTDWILDVLAERVSTVTVMKLGILGSADTLVAACATGADSIARLADLIRLGKLDAGLAGGVEAALHRVGFISFDNMHALNKTGDPEGASRPFDKGAAGFVMAEGGGVVVLESLAHARKRGAKIYAELLGYGHTSDAFHDTLPKEDGMGAGAIKAALKEAHVNQDEVGYINSHGTSTPKGDRLELDALLKSLGEHAKKIPTSSTKSMTGHLLGGAGGVETVIGIRSMHEGLIPATRNTENLIRDDMDIVIREPREVKYDIFGNSVLGFGGINHHTIWARWSY